MSISSRTFTISPEIQNELAHVRFAIPTPNPPWSPEAIMILDSPQLSVINASVFDWWYFDSVSAQDPRETVTVTFFKSTASAFPWLPVEESSVLIAYLWISFANGTIVEEYVPATAAIIDQAMHGDLSSSGNWSSTGFSWFSSGQNLSQYEIVVSSGKLQIDGRLTLTSKLPPHLPCGISPNTSTLEVAPHIGWAALIPDAIGSVDMTVKGSRLQFQGSAYHDKNWSDGPFVDSVASWYWGHGQVGPYSVVWFSYLASNDTNGKEYVSSYVARNGTVLVSSCHADALRVVPTGSSGTSARYPPRAGDVPDGFLLQFDLGAEGWLMANVSGTRIAGDNRYYFRWAGSMTGQIYESGPGDAGAEWCSQVASDENVVPGSQSVMSGRAIFEQFVLVE
ncbi:hypothetical protein POX_f07462 [Penicillium oxalicum]|uniref:hypothetical protein n=1 Tax=Penicillium oxalicum TaxID=69781 RepID=UPI0020B6523E|nr:hypothetical protein POX_f07462 [Penicillium oxalicum]KAI2787103.1 hypothetical protein POX_f07462 [Penicillium oxalicum]